MVKLVADKIEQADRFHVLALLKTITVYLENFEPEAVQYDDPLTTIRKLVHAIEDINSLKQPIKAVSVATKPATSLTAKVGAAKLETPHLSPYKQPKTLFSSPIIRR